MQANTSTTPAPKRRALTASSIDKAIRTAMATATATAPGKDVYLPDERRMYLLVKPNGAALWRLKYTLDGKQRLMSLGAFPDVSISQARDKRDEARKLVAAGVDPVKAKRAEKLARADSVEAIFEEWIDKQTDLKPDTVAINRARFDAYLKKPLGGEPISKVTPPDLLAALRKVEFKGRHETAHRVRSLAGRLWRYAIATGRAERDIAADLKDALAPVTARHFAAVTDPREVGQLLRAIDSYVGQPATRCALRLLPYVFVRSSEIRGAEWPEFDLDSDKPTWRIRAERMKMGVQHVVPLASQVVAILREIEEHSGGGRLVFASARGAHRPMSENTLNAALATLGYSGDRQTPHGFRTIASTMLNEMGFHPDLIERQLAHGERNKVRAAYNRAQMLDERRAMMQQWADHLDSLRAGGNVVPIGKGRKVAS